MVRRTAVQSVRAQPLIAVEDVRRSSEWYQALLGCRSGHGGAAYEMLMSGEEMILQIHAWEADDHVHMGRASLKSRGNGVLLWFKVEDFDAAVTRATALKATVLEAPHFNPNAGHREVWLRDLDGYGVVVAGE
ncbi:VOC family protein [Myxococcaceae bacterium JPH2]|nr:VOC family protein [Myxococcaceae bacterium JPH2]